MFRRRCRLVSPLLQRLARDDDTNRYYSVRAESGAGKEICINEGIRALPAIRVYQLDGATCDVCLAPDGTGRVRGPAALRSAIHACARGECGEVEAAPWVIDPVIEPLAIAATVLAFVNVQSARLGSLLEELFIVESVARNAL